MSQEMVSHVVSHFQEQASLYTVVILIFSYHFIFEKDIPCTCTNLGRDCTLYVLLPTLIILFALLWMDKRCHRGCKKKLCRRTCCRRPDCRFDSRSKKCFSCFRFLNAAFVSLIWIVSVLIDGDWYVCCTDHTHHDIACEDEANRSEEDRRALNSMNDESRIIGLGILSGLLLIAFLASVCVKTSECSVNGKLIEIVLEEEEKLVSKELREKLKQMMKNKLDVHINQSKWPECFTVGDEVIREINPPLQTEDQPQDSTQEALIN